jgi:hypothetical protein
MPPGAPAVIEPGVVSLPSESKWRAPLVVPGCADESPQPLSPAIEILSSGGMEGAGIGNIRVWDDGLVLFDGAGCPKGTGRRGRMTPDRVRNIVEQLERVGFFAIRCKADTQCNDSVITSMRAKRGNSYHTIVTESGCDVDSTLADQTLEFVMQAIGKNACSPMCLTTPQPAYCH